MDQETLYQLESAWKEAYAWETSPLHSLSCIDKRNFLIGILCTLHPQEAINEHYNCSSSEHLFDDCQSTYKFKESVKNIGPSGNPDILLSEYMDWRALYNCKCHANFTLFDALCVNASDSLLVQTFIHGNCSGFWLHIVLDHVVHRRLNLPSSVDDIPLLHYILEKTPRSSPLLFERMLSEEEGFYTLELTTPLKYMQYNPRIIAWILLRYPQLGYPFVDFNINNLCHLDWIGTLPHIAVLVLNGQYHPDDDAISSLLRNADIIPQTTPGSIKCRRLLLDYIKESLTTNRNKLSSMVFWCSAEYGPSDELMEIVASHLKNQTFALNIALLFLEITWRYPPPTPLRLNIDYWVLYFHEQGYYEKTTKACIKAHMRNYKIKWGQEYPVDARIINRLFLPDTLSSCNRYGVADRVFPNFGDISNINVLEIRGCSTPFYVYLEHLVGKSELFQNMVNQKAFRPPPGLDKGILKMEFDIPEDIQNVHKSIVTWISHCYTGLIPFDMSVDDVVDLYSLASYLMDDDCLEHCIKWLSQEFLINFRNHMDCKECYVCTSWKQHKL